MADRNFGNHVAVRRDDGVATILLSRPERLNAINDDLLRGLLAALDTCAGDRDVRAVILTGEGKAFCAGQDLGDRDPRKVEFPLDLAAIQRDLYHPVVRSLAEMDKPVIAALNGVAAGAGASIALGTDIVLAARSARLVFAFVRVGLSVDAGGGWHLVRALGPARARALLMTGAELGAEEAERMGLVFRCFEDDALAGEARDLAQKLADAPATAIWSIKASIRAAAEGSSLGEYLEIEADNQGAAGASPEYAEGVLAFLEKRKARFAR